MSLADDVVFCKACGAIGPFAEMSPYKKWIFTDSSKHKDCGGRLDIVYHNILDTNCHGDPLIRVRELTISDWNSMNSEERQQAIKEHWKIQADFARYQRELDALPPLTREESKKISNFTKYYDGNLTCPVCGSHVVKKLTTADRAVSVAAWGLASGKIGKQYECKDCGHKW